MATTANCIVMSWPEYKTIRDASITGVSLVLLSVEVVFFDARPSVLTSLLALLAAPLALRLDTLRKNGK